MSRYAGTLPVGAEEDWSDDDLDIEEDDEFRKRKLQHDKKKRQAEKVRSALQRHDYPILVNHAALRTMSSNFEHGDT